MSAVSVTLDDGGLGERLDELQRLTSISVAIRATVGQMMQNLKKSTPRRPEEGGGNLVGSMRSEITGTEGVVGYVADYAPHVEYGHRQNVGQYVKRLGKALRAPYVEGQHFLSEEVEAAGRRFNHNLKVAIDQELKRQGL